MQLHDMEEQLKNLDARTTAIEQFLPTLATKDDLRLTTDALQHEMAKLATSDGLNAGLEDAKRYTLLLIQATRGEIRQIRKEMATKGDLQELRRQMIAMNDDLRGEIVAVKGDLRGDIRTLSKQIAALGASPRKKKR